MQKKINSRQRLRDKMKQLNNENPDTPKYQYKGDDNVLEEIEKVKKIKDKVTESDFLAQDQDISKIVME